MRTGHVKKIRALREEDAVSPVIATILMVPITVVLAGTLYVWAANLAESNTDGDLELYTFDSNDAAGSPSTAADDNLAITTMTQGESIGWASLAVSVSVDGAAAGDRAARRGARRALVGDHAAGQHGQDDQRGAQVAGAAARRVHRGRRRHVGADAPGDGRDEQDAQVERPRQVLRDPRAHPRPRRPHVHRIRNLAALR